MRENFEQIYSAEIHQNCIPFLISAKLLRFCGCGQVDLAIVKSGKIEVFEVKTAPRISPVQKMRLRRAVEFISTVTDTETSLSYLVGR
jgi:hypothetical protein